MNTQLEEHATKNGEQGSLDVNHNGNVSDSIESFYSGTGDINFSDVFQSKHGYPGDFLASKISELMKLESLESATSQSLFSAVNRILEESIEKKNENIPQRVASVVKLVVQEIEHRVSKQAENMRKQRNLYKSREDRYQLKIRGLETLATGTIEENEIVMKQLQQIKIEKALIEKKMKLEENDLNILRKEKDHYEREISSLKQELELVKTTYEESQLQLETHAKKTKVQLEKRITELECLLADSRNKVKELEDFSESKFLRWKRKEHKYVHFINSQFGSLQELRLASESLKEDVLKTKEIYAHEVYHFGLNLKELVDAAQNYHTVLEENRKLYNEVQDLKGNIRVYCRIRPFLPGQSEKHTTIQYIGDNGELVVINPSKQGKDSHRLFKFNKVFGPAATQEEVFRDTQPLIRSVLDGYNVCIFAYGQTGSGKTYTMTGPSVTSVEDWGVNYRALNDLFNISQSRKSSMAYEVGVQMVEIYNEQVRDLLSNNSSQKRLGIWNTSQPNGLAVPDASMHPVRSTRDVLDLMSIGLMNRAVGATALNERSSRSHSVLTVHVRGTDLETSAVLRGCLHLVDLAGSERVERSEATGDRLREAQHINKSLSALGDVISALAQKSSHVPYRNSKLTQVLQGSLASQAKALMFIQLNPDVESFSETISTLKFAERASGVELGAARSNKEGRGVRELMEQMAFLKDVVMKKDEEIGRLRSFKTNGNAERRDMNSSSYRSASPKRHSIEAPHSSRTDLDNSSEYSDKHCEAGSQQSIDSLRHHDGFFQKSSLEIAGSSQNITEDVRSDPSLTNGGKSCNLDVGLLNFGDTDSEERLSDMSDGVFTMGTEADGTISNRVEHMLFPESAKRTSEIMEKRNVPVKLPRPHQKQIQAGSYRFSMGERSKVSSSKRATFGSSSAVKLPKQ